MKNQHTLRLLVISIILFSNQLLAQVPTITSFSPRSGSIGTEVVIAGTNFDATPENNIVYFGGIQATVSSASASELTVEVPAGASHSQISVTTNGLVAYSSGYFNVTFESDGTIISDPFGSPQTFNTSSYRMNTSGSDEWGPKAGDMDSDGQLDIVTADYDGGKYWVYQNKSTGVGSIDFATGVSFPLSAWANEIELSDFDGDGKLDVAVVTESPSGTSFFLQVDRNTTTGEGSFSFTTELLEGLDSYGWTIGIGDLNGDGKTDIVVEDADNNEVSIFVNTSSVGAISFADHVDFAVGAGPYSVTVADINADGLPEVLTVNATDNTVSILQNTSSGGSLSFATKADFDINAPQIPQWITAADLDGDGLLDVVVKNEKSFSTLRNISTTNVSLDAANQISTDVELYGSVQVNDFNGDGKTDLVYVKTILNAGILPNSSTVGAISFNGGVGFAHDDSGTVGTVGSADFDGDGEPDIMHLSDNANHLDVLRNKSSGTSITDFSIPGQLSPTVIDADSKTISVEVNALENVSNLTATFTLSNFATATVSGATQSSGFTANDFTDPVTYTVSAEDESAVTDWTVAVTLTCIADVVNLTEEVCESYDFDGEILRTSGTYSRAYTNVPGCDSIVTVDLTIHPLAFYEDVYAVNSYDFDGETLTISGQYEYGPFTSTETGCDSTFFLNLTIEPDTFDDQTYLQFQLVNSDFPIFKEFGESHIADVDGDGEKDIFFIGRTSDEIIASLFINNADGTYTEKTDHGISGIKVGRKSSLFLDANGDDNLDFLVIGQKGGGSNVTKLYLNDGVGNFSEKTDHRLPGFGVNVYRAYLDSADVDGDKDIDLIISISDRFESHNSKIWLNNGNGSFEMSTANDFPTVDALAANFADFDNDGDQDILMTGYRLEHKIWLNDGAGLFTPKLDQSLASLSFEGLVIFDMDGDGDLDIYDYDSRDFSNDYTAVYFNNGDGTFNYDISSNIPRLNSSSRAGFAPATKVADFDNDGDLDLIIEGIYNGTALPGLDYMDVWLNNGFGHFRALETHTVNIEASEFDIATLFKENGISRYNSVGLLSMNVFDFDRDGRVDVLINSNEIWDIDDDIIYEDVSRIIYNTSLSSDLTIEACESYEFDGSTLISSGDYQGVYTDEYGSTYSVNLDLTILEPEEVDHALENCGDYEFGTQLLTASGLYTETFTNQAGCDSTVHLSFEYLEEPSDFIEVKGVILFAEDQDGVTYQWIDCETDEPLDGETKKQLTPKKAGFYAVEVSNENCTVRSVCMNSDGVVLSALEVNEDILAYPNPTTSHVHLDLGQYYENVEVEVMSITGNRVNYIHNPYTKEISVDLGEKKGVYFVRVLSGNQLLQTLRTIKE